MPVFKRGFRVFAFWLAALLLATGGAFADSDSSYKKSVSIAAEIYTQCFITYTFYARAERLRNISNTNLYKEPPSSPISKIQDISAAIKFCLESWGIPPDVPADDIGRRIDAEARDIAITAIREYGLSMLKKDLRYCKTDACRDLLVKHPELER